MTRTTFIFSFLYVVIGIFSYFYSGRESATALIPSFFGVLYALVATIYQLKSSFEKLAIYSWAFITVIALGGTATGFVKFLTFLGGQSLERPLAVQVQSLFFVLSCLYFILLVRYMAKNTLARPTTT